MHHARSDLQEWLQKAELVRDWEFADKADDAAIKFKFIEWTNQATMKRSLAMTQ